MPKGSFLWDVSHTFLNTIKVHNKTVILTLSANSDKYTNEYNQYILSSTIGLRLRIHVVLWKYACLESVRSLVQPMALYAPTIQFKSVLESHVWAFVTTVKCCFIGAPAFLVNMVALAKLKLSDQTAHMGRLVWSNTVHISRNALFRVKHSRIA